MKTTRIVVALLLLGVVALFQFIILTPTEQVLLSKAGVDQVNGGHVEMLKLRGMQSGKETVNMICDILYVLIVLWLLKPVIKTLLANKNGQTAKTIMVLLLPLMLVSCMKAYDKPEYVEISNNETAFVFPLEGDTKEQEKFHSKEHLQQAKVASKRIQITHRWNQTGRWSDDGSWIPSIRVIKVDRSPVTRNWQATETNGHQTKGEDKDTAIWVESADSVGFSMGFACTAYVTEEDSSTFLYWYPSGSLANVMDTEIRARIQQGAAEVSAKYPLDLLRGKKQEIIDSIRKDVTVFFKERGITITTIGMFGGMTYENIEIQKSIDSVFIAQQEKEKAKAEVEAQQKRNEVVKLTAESIASKKQIEAEGEAKGIDVVQQALQKAGPLYIQREFITRWDGKFPAYYLGGGANGPSMLLGIPSPGAAPQPQQPAGKNQ
jgi:hypothetical protein